MRFHLLCPLLSLSYIASTFAVPVGIQTITDNLLGSAFGIPGEQTFDYVIVGGGTAGLALANRLSENPAWSVAVIEAGGFYEIENGNVSQIPLFASTGSDKTLANYNPAVDWGFVTEPQEARKLQSNDRSRDFLHSSLGRQQCIGPLCARQMSRWQFRSQLHGLSARYQRIL